MYVVNKRNVWDHAEHALCPGPFLEACSRQQSCSWQCGLRKGSGCRHSCNDCQKLLVLTLKPAHFIWSFCPCSWDPSGVTSHQLQELGVSSVQELQAVKDARVAARKALCEYLARPDASGPDKQRARCAFIHKNMRLPYQCRGCWLLPGNCVCNKLRKAKPSTKVVIHVHHDEWGRGKPKFGLVHSI